MLDEREVSEKMTRAQIIRQIIQRGISPRPGVPTGDIWEMSRICRQRAPLASIRCIPSIGVEALFASLERLQMILLVVRDLVTAVAPRPVGRKIGSI
jgi:hypothetical protein